MLKSEDVLEIGEAVISAKAHVVAKERQQQGVGHGLGDNGQINAGDARAEGEPAEDEGQQTRDEHHHDCGEPEHVEAVPEPGQLLVIQENHEVGQDGIGVDTAIPDLAHQVHAHGVAAEREEGAVAERENAAIAPDQIQRECQSGIAEVFAEKRDQITRHPQRVADGQVKV